MRESNAYLVTRVAVLILASSSMSANLTRGGRSALDGLPSAETILDRYIEVTGGKAAYQRLRSVVSEGTFWIVGTPMKGKYTAYEAEPNRTRTLYEFENGERNEQGTVGDIVWEKSTRDGARLATGEERILSLRESTFNSMLKWRSLYNTAKCSGTEAVGDKSSYAVVLSPPMGKPLTQYFDVESGLLVKSFILLDSPAGEIRSENLYQDYRKESAGVSFPHKLIHRIVNEQEMVVLLDSVRCNVDIVGYPFDPPPEVKALAIKEPQRHVNPGNP